MNFNWHKSQEVVNDMVATCCQALQKAFQQDFASGRSPGGSLFLWASMNITMVRDGCCFLWNIGYASHLHAHIASLRQGKLSLLKRDPHLQHCAQEALIHNPAGALTLAGGALHLRMARKPLSHEDHTPTEFR